MKKVSIALLLCLLLFQTIQPFSLKADEIVDENVETSEIPNEVEGKINTISNAEEKTNTDNEIKVSKGEVNELQIKNYSDETNGIILQIPPTIQIEQETFTFNKHSITEIESVDISEYVIEWNGKEELILFFSVIDESDEVQKISIFESESDLLLNEIIIHLNKNEQNEHSDLLLENNSEEKVEEKGKEEVEATVATEINDEKIEKNMENQIANQRLQVHSIVYSKPVVFSDTIYANFYNFSELPESSINLLDTFSLIKPSRDGGNTNIGPSIKVNSPNVAIITENEQWQFGGMWYRNPINMDKDFSMMMYVNLGNKWGNGSGGGATSNEVGGADGITFTIQGDTNTRPREGDLESKLQDTLGANGAGLGAYSKDNDNNDPYNAYRDKFISNALVLEFDTFYNNLETLTHDNGAPNFGNGGPAGEKFFGHIDLTRTGSHTDGSYYKKHENLNHPNTSFRSVDLLNFTGNQDLTDNRWRKVQVNWDRDELLLTYEIAGYAPIIYQFPNYQEVINTFGGDLVHWGFTGSTGHFKNLQQVGIFDLPDQTEKEIVKQVRNITKDGESATYAKESIVKIGDIVEYEVVFDYPAQGNTQDLFEPYIEDVLPEGVDYVPDSLSVFKVESGIENELSNINWDNGKITFLSNNEQIHPGDTFIFRYQGEVMTNGIQDNTATFYSKYTNPISDTARIYNGGLVIKKIDENGEPLPGAKFTISGPDDFLMEDIEISNESATTIIPYLEQGEYIIEEITAPEGYLLSEGPLQAEVVKGNEDAEVIFTNFKQPELLKEQRNLLDDSTDFGEYTQTLVGEAVEFKITALLPKDISTYKTFELTDQIDQRLSYIADSVYLETDNDVQLAEEDYTIEYNSNDRKIVLQLHSTAFPKLEASTELYLYFATEVNLQSIILEDFSLIDNIAHLDITNKADIDYETESNVTQTDPITGEVEIFKYYTLNQTDQIPLANAIFKLQTKVNNEWEDIRTLETSDEDGYLGWDLLPKGEYRIVEIEAPEGFNLLANPILFEVNKDEQTHSQSFSVENRPKEEIPNTGGLGTLLYTLIGTGIMVFAIVQFVYNKRRKEEKR